MTVKNDAAAQVAITEFIAAREAVREFQRTHFQLFAEWELLIERYNKAVTVTKAACKDGCAGKSMDFGGGVSTRVSVERHYDPNVLAQKAPGVFAEPGVVLKVSLERINELIVEGVLPAALMKEALIEEKKVAVYGATPVVVKC